MKPIGTQRIFLVEIQLAFTLDLLVFVEGSSLCALLFDLPRSPSTLELSAQLLTQPGWLGVRLSFERAVVDN